MRPDNQFRVPVNRLAQRVLKPGVHFELEFGKISQVHSREPLPIIPPTAPEQVALIGTRHGRFCVIGVGKRKRGVEGRKTNSSTAKYVVKCDCGAYEYRSMGGLRPSSVLACQTCAAVARLRLTERKRLSGSALTKAHTVEELRAVLGY